MVPITCSRSLIGQSVGLMSQRLGVRVSPRAQILFIRYIKFHLYIIIKNFIIFNNNICRK